MNANLCKFTYRYCQEKRAFSPRRGNGGNSHDCNSRARFVRATRRDFQLRKEGHFRVVPRYGIRVVRLLSLRNAGAVLRRVVLSSRQRYGRAALRVCDLRGRLPDPPVRRCHLRSYRRSRRPQVHLPGDDRHHGLLDVRCRSAADVPADRLDRARAARHAPVVAGSCPWRRIRRSRNVRG